MRRKPVTHLWTPTSRWSSCVYAYLSRDTVGCELQGRELENRFPASSFVSLNWFLEGAVDLPAADASGRARILPSRLIIGKTGPVTTTSRGDIRYFGVSMYPDAFTAAFGVSATSLEGEFVDAADVLDADGLAMIDAVAAAASDTERAERFEAYLERHAAGFRVSLWTSALRAGTQLSVDLMARMLARGRRQTIRTTQRALGVGVADLRRFARGTQAFEAMGKKRQKDQPVSLSDIAATSGYADQSHLTRDAKQVTGRSPAAFLRDFETDEADWIYRATLEKREPPKR